MTTAEPVPRIRPPGSTPIRDLGLTIAGLAAGADPGRVPRRARGRGDPPGPAPVLPLDRVGRARRHGRHRDPVLPRPARPDRAPRRARRATSRGSGRADILRYLRHEMGHVVNYAYRLFEPPEWVEPFGPMDRALPRGVPPRAVQPPVRPPPARLVRPEASRRGLGRDLRRLDDPRARLAGRVRRLARRPGQAPVLRPDDGRAGRPRPARHRRRPRRGRRRARLLGRRPLPGPRPASSPTPPGLDGMLRSIFEDLGRPELAPADAPRLPASDLLRRLERDLIGRRLPLDRLLPRADPPADPPPRRAGRGSARSIPVGPRGDRVVAVTTLVTALAMNHVCAGRSSPDRRRSHRRIRLSRLPKDPVAVRLRPSIGSSRARSASERATRRTGSGRWIGDDIQGRSAPGPADQPRRGPWPRPSRASSRPTPLGKDSHEPARHR